jgi:hypothetical protein
MMLTEPRGELASLLGQFTKAFRFGEHAPRDRLAVPSLDDRACRGLGGASISHFSGSPVTAQCQLVIARALGTRPWRTASHGYPSLGSFSVLSTILNGPIHLE